MFLNNLVIVIVDLQNDLKHLMKQIEEGLHKIHEEAREEKKDNKNSISNENKSKQGKTIMQINS